MSNLKRLTRRPAFLAIVCVAVCFCAGSGGYLLGLTLEGSGQSDNARDLRLARISASRTGRQMIANELIEGRVTFQTAIERFETLSNHNPDYFWTTFRQAFPGTGDQQRFGHQVISFVASELMDKPDQAKALTNRLATELISAQGEGTLSPVE